MQHRFALIFCSPIGSADILLRPNAVVGSKKDKSSVWPPELDKGVRATCSALPPLCRPKVSHCSNDSFTLSTFTRYLFLFRASQVTGPQCSRVFHVQNSRSRMPVSAGLPQCVSQDTPQTKPAHPFCPNRFCPNPCLVRTCFIF